MLLLSSLAFFFPQLWMYAAIVAGVATSLLLLGYWLVSYPEWPANQHLRRRLVRAVLRREHDVVGFRQPAGTQRMVEWVPREDWTATTLETASDVMLIQVDRSGIKMEGDRQRYIFPGACIIDVCVESIRPSGSFHQLHYVVLLARTESGPIEFPIAYRDHGWRSLSSKNRYEEAMELCQQIAAIATGGDFTYRHAGHDVPPLPKHQQLNPFAAPRMT